MKHLRLLVVAIVATTAMCATPCAMAAEAKYTSYPYYTDKVSGPNQFPIDENWAENNSGKGLCSRMWEWLGGSNYTMVASTCSGEWVGLGTWTACSINGHGTAARYYEKYTYILSGWQHYNGCA